MLAGRVDRHARTHIPRGMMLRDRRRSLRWIQSDSLYVALDVNVSVGSDPPTQSPIDREVIVYIDVIIDYDGNFPETGAHRPQSVHELPDLALELLV